MAYVGRNGGNIQPYSKENKEVLRGMSDPRYGKDLNTKLRSLNKFQQRSSKSFTAKKHQNQLHTRGKTSTV